MDFAKAFTATKVEDFKTLEITSPSFEQHAIIPSRFTCDGININPALSIHNIPKEAKSLAILVDDPDAPDGSFCHWVTWNIPVTHFIKEKERRGMTGTNDFGDQRYGGPCPLAGMHRYFFNVYALDCTLDNPITSDKPQIEKAMAGHVLAFGVLMGRYQRMNRA